MPKADEIRIILCFCDESTATEAYDITHMGVLTARDEFMKAIENAEDNDKVWMVPPHVIKAELEVPDIPKTVMEFPCQCHQAGKKVMSNA